MLAKILLHYLCSERIHNLVPCAQQYIEKVDIDQIVYGVILRHTPLLLLISLVTKAALLTVLDQSLQAAHANHCRNICKDSGTPS